MHETLTAEDSSAARVARTSLSVGIAHAIRLVSAASAVCTFRSPCILQKDCGQFVSLFENSCEATTSVVIVSTTLAAVLLLRILFEATRPYEPSHSAPVLPNGHVQRPKGLPPGTGGLHQPPLQSASS